MKAAFGDEFSVYKDKRKNSGYIILSRYRHLVNLTKKQKEELNKLNKEMSSRKFPSGHVSKFLSLKKSLELIKDKELIRQLKAPPKLLQGEAELLSHLEIKTRLFGRQSTKTDSGKYSFCFDLFINRKDCIKKFYKHIGYLSPKKQIKLKSIVWGENAIKTV